MMYWIILLVLGVLIITTIVVTIVTIVKERKEYKNYELDDIEDIDDDDEDEDDYDDRSASKAKKSGSSNGSGGNKRRWKIILENTDSGERHTYIFFEGLGIGRTTKEAAFEEFFPIPYDKKISKVHCAIVRNRDKLYLRDEGSKNHTYLNGKKVQKPVFIQKEDIISIGQTDLEVIKILRETN